jgi:hypothetical protein
MHNTGVQAAPWPSEHPCCILQHAQHGQAESMFIVHMHVPSTTQATLAVLNDTTNKLPGHKTHLFWELVAVHRCLKAISKVDVQQLA